MPVLLHSDLLHALDASLFAREALNVTLDPWQRDALRSTAQRQVWLCSRQAGKSVTAAALAAHTALYQAGSLTLLISPSLRQSAELFRKVGDVLDNLDQRPALTEDNKLSLTMTNRSRVVSLPSSESTVRGFSGVNLIIEDEASRVDDSLHAAIRPMLAVSGGRMILMSTPAGKRGHFYDVWQDGGDRWQRTIVTASDVPRISADFLADERAALGERWYRQEYACSFEETEGALFDYATIAGAITNDIAPLFGGDR